MKTLIAINGAAGRMGQRLVHLTHEDPALSLVGALEAPGHPAVYVPESPVPENQFHFWGRYDEYEARKAPVLNDQEDSRDGVGHC